MSDFVSTDLIAFDIDSGMTIDEAEDVVEKLNICGLAMPSPSHTPEDHRFRLVFPLAKTITDVEVFKATYSKLAENFPVDPQTSDACRFYFGCTTEDGFFFDGELYAPMKPEKAPEKLFNREAYNDSIPVLEDVEDVVKVLYGEGKDKIPEQVDFFIRNAHTGLEGLWHNSANNFVFTLSLQGVPFETVSQVFEQLAPEPLDDHDQYLLERAYKDGESKRVENVVDKKPEKRYPRRRSRRRSR